VRTIDEELRAQEEHGRWLAGLRPGAPKWKGPGPAPGACYKDCPNCPVRPEQEPEDRAAFCARWCPWDDLPAGPSMRFRRAAIWASLPEGLLNAEAVALGVRFCMDVQAIKEWREAKKMEAMMGAGFRG